MARKRKLTEAQVQAAAQDRRNGTTWKGLSMKYKCSINTVRKALSEYSGEFTPLPPLKRSVLEERVTKAETEIARITSILKKRFNIHL